MPIVNGSNRRRRDGSKTEEIKIRISKEDANMLKFASEKLGMTKSDVVRKGIVVEYNLAKIRTESDE